MKVWSARLFALVLVLQLSACASGTEHGGGTLREGERPSATPIPSPQPPMNGPEPACTSDTDCVATAFVSPLHDARDCYCPGCPQPLAATTAATHQASWEKLCGPAFEGRAACRTPLCARPPGRLACVAGRCGWAVDPGR